MTAVPVTAEWALWGKEEHDTGYRLLSCSQGTISRQHFIEALTRYSPGTLDSLPQMTVSWLADSDRRGYLAIAIHDAPGRTDAAGREIVFTSYFCVPFSQLAAGGISYSAMYECFRNVRLPVAGRAAITAQFAVQPPAAPPGDGLAARVAALLLTSAPVCVLGADLAGPRERLAFIDEVAALLPYGMRSRLSASTWASSTQRGHKLRLFFSSARRQAEDHVVTWGQRYAEPMGHGHADDYLRWLAADAPPADTLARFTQPLDLARQADIRETLEWLKIRTAPPAPPPPPPGAEDLLRSFAQRLRDGKHPGFHDDLDALRAHLTGQVLPGNLARYQEIIKENGLFLPDLPVRKSQAALMYDVLLRLAFCNPLDYEAYCQVEDCAGGTAQGAPHPALALAMLHAGATGTARLLAGAMAGHRELHHVLHDRVIPPATLLAMAAEPALRPGHAHLVLGTIIQDMLDWPDVLDTHALRAALQRHGYLLTPLRRSYPEDPTSQMNVLVELLVLAHGRKLGADDLREVFAHLHTPPSIALLAALVQLVEPSDVGYITWRFTHELIARSSLDDEARKQVVSLLEFDPCAWTDDAGEQAAQAAPRRGRRLWGGGGAHA